MSTNIGHRFLSLVDKHFHKDYKLRKIFNRNTIKISYSCMSNTKRIIDNHNQRILKSSELTANTGKDNKTCNCRQKNTCPLNGNCLQSSVVYQATVTRQDNNITETYVGLTENDFKTRYRNHTASVVDRRNYSRIFQFTLRINVKISEHAPNFNVFKPRLVCGRIFNLALGQQRKFSKI